MNTKRNTILAGILTFTLISFLALPGCGSLSRILAEPDPPREASAEVQLSRLLRTGEEYEGIEIFHGTKDEPKYGTDNKAYMYEDRGWIYLHLEGAADKRGYQHGWLLADYIQLQIDHNISMLAEVYSLDWKYLRSNAERMWGEKVSEEYKAELEGIVAGATKRGATFDYLDLLVMNGLEELRDCWFPTVSEQYYSELAAGLWNPYGAPVTVQTEPEPSEDEEEAAGSEDNGTKSEEDATDNTSEATAEESANEDTKTEDSTQSEDETKSEDETNADTKSEEDGSSKDEDASKEDENDSKDEDEPKNPIATLPKVEIEGETSFYGNEELAQRGSEPFSIYTKQASAIIATGSVTEDGKVILAQNTYAGYADSNFSNVIIDMEPKEGERFTMQTAPGFIHSVGEAYSSSSLVVANTRISGFNVYSEAGTPEFIRIRQAVQYATTLNEFTNAMLEDVNGGIASNWLVGDIETNQIMEFELGLSYYRVHKVLDGGFISFGAVEDARIKQLETTNISFTDTRTSNTAHFARMVDLLNIDQGELTPELAQTILSDHYDVYLSKSHACSRSLCMHGELDSAEYDVSAETEPNMPYGMAGAKVMSSDLAAENTIIARWSSACGREFNATIYSKEHTQYIGMHPYLYDRSSELWCTLSPLDTE